MELKNEDLEIYGKIVSVSTEGVVAEAVQIYDGSATNYVSNGKQSSINKYFKSKQDQVIADINSLKEKQDSIKHQYDEIQSIPMDILSQILKL